ncbi:MAG: undecaprenyl-diphosphatase UppP [Candidatus Doudnabacteria bacterium]|jgi:undecaprenyl-diphosphatase
MTIFQSAILGLVQGLGEFLPVSSSAHLILAPWFFNWKDPGLGFDVALHWGTLLAVLVYFRSDVWLIIKGFWHSLFKSTRDLKNNIYQKLSWLLIIASVPGAIIGKLLEKKAETIFRDPLLIAGTLSVFGVIIWWVDWVGAKEKNLDRIKWTDAMWVGLSQALAIIPGVSRSGSTMASGMFLGFKREDAARFSFLMSMPIIFGAGLANIKNFHTGVTTMELVVGFTSAAIFGFLSIKFLLRYLSNHGFKIFVWYRLALAAVILAVYFIRK